MGASAPLNCTSTPARIQGSTPLASSVPVTPESGPMPVPKILTTSPAAIDPATHPGLAHSNAGRRRLSETLRTRATGGRTGHRKNSPGHRLGHRGMPPEEARAFHDRRRTGQPTSRGTTRTEPQRDAGTLVARGTDHDR